MAALLHGTVRVQVPATSANLGPGYDALGLALDLLDEVSAAAPEDLAPGQVDIEVEGEGAGTVPLDERHLVYRAMVQAFDRLEVEVPGLRLRCRNVVPHGRGLGSSSAAIVAGLAAARALVPGGALRMDDDALFALAARIEGHPDNVAPAVLGGCTVAWSDGARFRAVPVPVDPRVRATVLVPETPLETAVARSLLPRSVPHADAAANAGRAALLVAALAGRPDLLLDATEDRLHQEYRAPAMPQTIELVHELRDQGLAAVVSGAGPTVLVLSEAARLADLEAMRPEGWRLLEPALSPSGARVRLPH